MAKVQIAGNLFAMIDALQKLYLRFAKALRTIGTITDAVDMYRRKATHAVAVDTLDWRCG